MTRPLQLVRPAAAAAAALLGFASASRAQAALERTPNVSGEWIGLPGTIYFNFVHRFTTSDAPERKVANTPTFVLAAPLAPFAVIGTTYGTNSTLASRFPNEHEYFARVSPLRQRDGAPLDAGLHVDYNDAARGPDAELGVGRWFGPLRVLAAGRVLRRSDSSAFRYALAGGSVLRLGSYLALSGDVATVTHRLDGERIAWAAAVQAQLPLTPHTLAFQVTNVGTGTLQGSSRGDANVRYGFEFTIPFTLQRYLHRRSPAAMPADSAAHGATVQATAGPIVRIRIQGLAFRMPEGPIAAGTTVEWKNDDPLAHTVTASDGSFQSPLIEPGKTWRHTFATPGTYNFTCTPHPFMRGVVVVR
jgi:plastocyanin